jgi:1-acyl-sn-glycerol-3-phosphate acyltransferase
VKDRPEQFDYSRVVYAGRSFAHRLSRRLLVQVLRGIVRLDLEGLEQLPAGGGYVLAANHLHALDPAIGLLLVPGRVVGVVKEKWNRVPFRWLLRAMSDVVFVGSSNRRALDAAVAELTAGAVVAILPEGTRSRTGVMAEGHRGVALLAARARAPVVPAAAFGQERAAASWRRMRRVPVHVRIGEALAPPHPAAGKSELLRYTDDVMLAIAALLPDAYRGAYARRSQEGVAPRRPPTNEVRHG